MTGPAIGAVSLTPDSKTLTLTITNEQGSPLSLSFTPSEYQVFLARMIGIGTEASKQRTNVCPVDFNKVPPSTFFPSELTQTALAEAETKQLLLVVRLFDLDLSFEVTKPRLRALAVQLDQAVKALDADEAVKH